MEIKFLVSGAAWKPLGGLRMIYEYANRLAADGHKVSIYYSANSDIGLYGLPQKAKAVVKYLYLKYIKSYKCSSWFKLSPQISENWLWKFGEAGVGYADRYIATTIESAYNLKKFTAPAEKKYYFIQDFENWGFRITDDHVIGSYKFGFRNIVISDWLKRIIDGQGVSCVKVQNGFDLNQFYVVTPPKDRCRYEIAMMYNPSPRKGCADCFSALEIVHKKYPELHVSAFGIPERPESLPEWYSYYKQPSRDKLRELYNSAAIFIGASYHEGWGLTIGEAMLCGCAVACTDNPGYCEMAKSGKTALVSPVKSPSALADNIIALVEDEELRCRIADASVKYMASFDLEYTYNLFRQAIGC